MTSPVTTTVEVSLILHISVARNLHSFPTFLGLLGLVAAWAPRLVVLEFNGNSRRTRYPPTSGSSCLSRILWTQIHNYTGPTGTTSSVSGLKLQPGLWKEFYLPPFSSLKDDDLAGKMGWQPKELNKVIAVLANDCLVKMWVVPLIAILFKLKVGLVIVKMSWKKVLSVLSANNTTTSITLISVMWSSGA